MVFKSNATSIMVARKTFDYARFIVFAVLVLGLLSLRSPLQISDGDSYVSHASMRVDLAEPEFYLYPLYWGLVWCLGWIGELQFPSLLSVLVSSLIIISCAELSSRERYFFLILALLDPLSFNSEYVALRNGVALGMLLFGVARSSSIWVALSPLMHPGIFPVAALVLFLKYLEFSWRSFAILLVLVGVTLYVSGSFLEELMKVRGYEGAERVGEAWFVYAIYALLAFFYWKAMRKSRYALFLPVMVALWILVGAQYSFAWRLFVQGLPISLFMLLKYSERGCLYRFLFLSDFFIFSLYSASKWHSFTEYSDGWLGYWLTFF